MVTVVGRVVTREPVVVTVGHLVHGVDGEHDEHVHDVVRVEAAVHGAGEPLLRNVHGADHTAAQRHRVLGTKSQIQYRALTPPAISHHDN